MLTGRQALRRVAWRKPCPCLTVCSISAARHDALAVNNLPRLKRKNHALLSGVTARQIIRTLVEENEREDGTFRFDPVRALIALDFAKTEIARMIDGADPR